MHLNTSHHRQKAQGPFTPHTRKHTGEAGEPQEATSKDAAVLDRGHDKAAAGIAHSQILLLLEAGALRRADPLGTEKVTEDIIQTGEQKEQFIGVPPGAATGLLQQPGAKIPKGILLADPPGTDKTSMATALAKEPGTPLNEVSVAEFIKPLVGFSASHAGDALQQVKMVISPLRPFSRQMRVRPSWALLLSVISALIQARRFKSESSPRGDRRYPHHAATLPRTRALHTGPVRARTANHQGMRGGICGSLHYLRNREAAREAGSHTWHDIHQWHFTFPPQRLPNHGNGDCLFFSVVEAPAVANRMLTQQSLRQGLAQFMATHADDWSPFWDGLTPSPPGLERSGISFQQYTELIATPGNWGGGLELGALAAYLNISILAMGLEALAIYGTMDSTAARRRLCLWHEASHFELVTSYIPEWIWHRGHGAPPSTHYAATQYAGMRGGGKHPRRTWQPLTETTTTGLMDGPRQTSLTLPFTGRGGIRRLHPASSERERTLRQTGHVSLKEEPCQRPRQQTL